MPPRLFIKPASLMLLSLCLACAGSNDRGRALYAEGRYIEAAEVFEHSEPRLTSAIPRDRAVYGLYRGLTMLRLGDIANTARWLDYAEAAEHEAKGSLSPNEQRLMRAARDRIGQEKANHSQAPDLLREAWARTAATGSVAAPDVAPSKDSLEQTAKEQAPIPSPAPNP